jgi:two-component system CheB/CheR fusion protein
VIPHLLEGKPTGSLIRIWVPGCSTGEEAYSLAILLQECHEMLKRSFQIQIFATDVDSKAIERARAGIYPASIAADVSPERLARFFAQEADGSAYRIRKNLRDLVVFSEQNVIRDPPFSRMDLVSCRNLLIYMGGELQKKLIPLFHYSLNPGGVLLLGTSETVGESDDLFSTLDRKAKLYSRRKDSRPPRAQLPSPMPPHGTEGPTPKRPPGKGSGESHLRQLTEEALLHHYAGVGALVNAKGDILYLHGRTGHYLELAPGEAGTNILKMAREGLRQELTIALHQTVARKEPVHHANLRVKTNGDFTRVNLTVRPVNSDPADQSPSNLFLVVLEESPEQASEIPESPVAGTSATDAQVAVLRQELRAKEEYLQTTIEELQTSNEEMRSSNEEMQSVNEELQSTNEEMETAKEELQSVNEELSTVNSELQTKVADLSRANNDLNNLMAGTGVATLFVDHALRIQRFTPSATLVINLILSDVGRPVGDIVSNLLGYNCLVADIQEVLDKLAPKEAEVQTKAGAWFLLRVRPYRTLENVIEGAVVTFFDITEIKTARAALRESEGLRRLATVVQDSRDAILLQDLEGRILAWNQGAQRLYGWSEEEALRMNVRDLIPEAAREEALSVVRKLVHAEALVPYRAQRVAKDGRSLEVTLMATALVQESGEVYAIATTERAWATKPPGEEGSATPKEEEHA